MSQIVNESTSVVRVDSSGLQNGHVAVVYVSTTTIPGQLISIIDGTGYTSTPQSILVSTTGGAALTDHTWSTSITQRFGYLTLASQDLANWAVVARASFSNPLADAVYYGLDAVNLYTGYVHATNFVSTNSVSVHGLLETGGISAEIGLYTSSIYINDLSGFYGNVHSGTDISVLGSTYATGSTIVRADGIYEGAYLSTSSDILIVENMHLSAKTFFGQDTQAGGNLAGQSLIINTLNSISSTALSGQAEMVGPVAVESTLQTHAISTQASIGNWINVQSNITFCNAPLQAIQNRANGLKFVDLSLTLPGVSTNWLVASNSLATSNLYLQNFNVSSISYLTLGATAISNPEGTLDSSGIQANYGVISTLTTVAVENAQTTSVVHLSMNDLNAGDDFFITVSGNMYEIPGYWVISSLSTNGTLNGPDTLISTTLALTDQTLAGTFTANPNNITITEMNAYEMTVQGSVVLEPGVLSMQNAPLDNTGGLIAGPSTVVVQSAYCSSIVADVLSTPGTIQFLQPITGILQNTYISTVSSPMITTSSLFATSITIDQIPQYSTINPSTPWLATSSFNMNTGPFMKTTGLGTYVNPVSFVAASNETVYYSVVNPPAQETDGFGYPQVPIYLTMNMAYTNYYTSTGTATITINGNTIRTFYGSDQSDGSLQISGTDIYTYPMIGVNPVYGDATPYIEISQADANGYTKLSGSLFLESEPNQALLRSAVDSNAGIQMNSGTLGFPNAYNMITIDNHANDMTIRNIFYSGQLLNPSDPALKEGIESADEARCYSTVSGLPLRRFAYCPAYLSTFHVKDRSRLGFLTTDVEPVFPKSVHKTSLHQPWAPSTIHTLDSAQIRASHYGATRALLGVVSTLEWEVETLLAQRNNLL